MKTPAWPGESRRSHANKARSPCQRDWHAHLARDHGRDARATSLKESGDAVCRVAAGSKRGREKNYCRVPALVELLTSRLNVTPLSSRTFPVLRLSVEPPSAE